METTNKMSDRAGELTVGQLWSPCDPEPFNFETTASLTGEISIIGQDRAVQAIDFGTGIGSFGFNIYALGYTGTGRSTTIRTFLERIAADQPVPNDWIYVHNFADPNRPHAIPLPPGMASEFRRDMHELVNDLLREIPRAFESAEYEQQREQILREVQEQSSQEFSQLERRVNDRGFTLVKTATGFGIAPVLNGQVLTPDAYQQLDSGTRQDIEGREELLQSEIAGAMRRVRDVEKKGKHQVADLDRQIAEFAVAHFIQELKEKHGHIAEVMRYLEDLQAHIVDNADQFKSHDDESSDGVADPRDPGQSADLQCYAVNVVVDNSQQQGAPVILEPNPIFSNLIGRIEHRSEFGALVTDFTMIRPGALHRANGGYLVVEIRGLLANPLAWEALKRSLKNRQLRIEEIGRDAQAVSTVTLEPEPVPLNAKVILIGDPMTYYLLYDYDEDFRKLFKVKADFGVDFDRTPEACRHYAQFIAARCQQEGLLPFDRQAVGRVVEYGSRLAEHQQKLSTRFGEIADLIREASFWAKRRGVGTTAAQDVLKAIDQKIHRSNRAEEEFQELIDEGTIRVDVAGSAVGQVNGLSVMSMGDYSFAKPSRITARTYTGKAGVVSLDREARLSGRIYDKGLLTLNGYLGGKYALDTALSLSATLSFEQLYDEIEGDSASSSELYALLSSLSGLPLKQGIAVTGSVDQQGNIQPIGAVNEKIEGFYLTCKHRGLTGEQGVLLPALNTVNLMLNAEVRQAVDEGKFHIYAVRTIDEGIRILTGVPAGEIQLDGTYPPESVHGRVTARLREIADNLDGTEEEEEEEDKPEGDCDDCPEEADADNPGGFRS
jgi:lon-related putative ATP-dependent protease